MQGIRPRGETPQAAVLSFFLHAGVVLFALLWGRYQSSIQDKQLIWIDVSPDNFKKQIVDTEAGEDVKQAPDKAYLSKSNKKVQEEMVRKWTDSTFSEVSIQKSTPVLAQAKNETAPSELKTELQKKARADLKDLQKTPVLSQFGVKLFSDQKAAKKPERDIPQWMTPGGIQSEYIKGLKEGEVTALNTKEYVYYSYFRRIRVQLDRAWRPILRSQLVKLIKKGRKVAEDMDYTTRTVVTLNQIGKVIRVQVIEESGARDLDDAAIKAFNRAGPFPNPPKALVESNGLFQIRWDFILRT